MSKKFSWFGLRKQKPSDEHPESQQTNAEDKLELPTEQTNEIQQDGNVKPSLPVEDNPASESQPSPAAELTSQEEPTEAVTHSSAEQDTVVESHQEEESQSAPAVQQDDQAEAELTTAPTTEPDQSTTEQGSVKKFFSRLKQGLMKTSENIGSGVASLFVGKKIDDDLFEELETHLLMADVGIDTTTKVIEQLTQHASRKQLKDADALYDILKSELGDMLKSVEQPLQIPTEKKPFVILMVGVNGVGKTTTIGKLAHQFRQQGKSVMLAAGDTFRAAAVEQLQVWGERNDIPVIAQHTGADSASVLFDAFQAAQSRNVDILIADTAGRLQNKDNLMEELKKVVRVMKKLDDSAPHEIMLTLDAATGQNAVNQAKLFDEAVGLTGINLTKLDGTAKGGVIFAIADQFNIPIRYIGVGEGIEDLRQFDSHDFIDALFTEPQDSE